MLPIGQETRSEERHKKSRQKLLKKRGRRRLQPLQLQTRKERKKLQLKRRLQGSLHRLMRRHHLRRARLDHLLQNNPSHHLRKVRLDQLINLHHHWELLQGHLPQVAPPVIHSWR